jgi:hypothetical protein
MPYKVLDKGRGEIVFGGMGGRKVEDDWGVRVFLRFRGQGRMGGKRGGRGLRLLTLNVGGEGGQRTWRVTWVPLSTQDRLAGLRPKLREPPMPRPK